MGLQLMASEENYDILLAALLNIRALNCVCKGCGYRSNSERDDYSCFDQTPMMSATWQEWGGCWYCHGSLLLSLARRASCKGCLIHSYRPTFQGLDQLSVWGLWMLLQPCPRHVQLADLVGGFSFTDHCPQCSTVVPDCTSFFSLLSPAPLNRVCRLTGLTWHHSHMVVNADVHLPVN